SQLNRATIGGPSSAHAAWRPRDGVSPWSARSGALGGTESVATRITTTDPPAPMRWTLDDYHRATDAGLFDGRHVEPVDGEIYEMPPMREPHIGGSQVPRAHFRAIARFRSATDRQADHPAPGWRA